MNNIWPHAGLALAMASMHGPFAAFLGTRESERIGIEYLHTNTESPLGKITELREYMRAAGYDGGGFSCDMGRAKSRGKDNELVFLNSPICVTPNPQDYKEGRATVRGVVFSRHLIYSSSLTGSTPVN